MELEGITGEIKATAKFIQEDRNCRPEVAMSVAIFMDFASNFGAVEEANIWGREGIVRVYFKPWSQNRFRALRYVDRAYFDPELAEVFFEIQWTWNEKVLLPLSSLDRPKNHYSGAKTRRAIERLKEGFIWLKPSLESLC
jgi:hypothetical protein